MTVDPSGMQEPEEPKFNFSQGQSVRIVDGPFTEFVGTVSESNREQKKVTVLISYWGKPTRLSSTSARLRKSKRFSHRYQAQAAQLC